MGARRDPHQNPNWRSTSALIVSREHTPRKKKGKILSTNDGLHPLGMRHDAAIWPAEARLTRLALARRFRGTMVMHMDREADETPLEMLDAHAARSQARHAGRRRVSTGGVAAVDQPTIAARREPTVYQVLIALLFATSGFRPRRSEETMNTLFSLTRSKRPLTKADKTKLERSFNVMYEGLGHLFMPWRPYMQGRADAYIDIAYVSDAILALEREATLALQEDDVRRLREPITRFLKLVGVSRRRTTM
jgi:hypothetical protein